MDDVCPGEGRCHGCLSWCAWCGTVGGVCDSERGSCDCHPECDYPGCLVLNCWEHRDYDPKSVVEFVMES